jgi:hypothetical protein
MGIKKSKKLENIIVNISKDLKVSMDVVENVILKYRDYIDNVSVTEEIYPEIPYGIMGLDSHIHCNHGITLIHGFDSSGKTSILKTMALSASILELNTLYHDPENKLFLKHMENIEGILFSNSSSIIPIKEWLHDRLLDIIIVDSFSGMVTNSQKLLIHQLRKSVPYVIGSTQMRYSFEKLKHVPACAEVILSTSHTRIMITGGETIKFGQDSMKRIYVQIEKYKDQKIEKSRLNLIIKNNIVCNFHQCLDTLRIKNRLTNVSNKRYLDKKLLGTYDEILNNKEYYIPIFKATAEELNVQKYTDHYIAMHEMFYNRDKSNETTKTFISEESKSSIPV